VASDRVQVRAALAVAAAKSPKRRAVPTARLSRTLENVIDLSGAPQTAGALARNGKWRHFANLPDRVRR
jgi:hypothetical protein